MERAAQLSRDVCHSIASQFFLPNDRIGTDAANTSPNTARVSGLFHVLFPLSVTGGSLGVSEELHNWVMKMLEKIGCTMGIHQALIYTTCDEIAPG
jgi:hypothetical protein